VAKSNFSPSPFFATTLFISLNEQLRGDLFFRNSRPFLFFAAHSFKHHGASMTTPPFTRRDLFGGAITCEIPTAWRDVSDVRQVPDHQECFQEMDGAVVVIEILERQGVSDAEAASYFFRDLAEANGSKVNDFQTMPITGVQMEHAVLCRGVGNQRVAMERDYDMAGNRRTNQEVRSARVELCLFRLARVSTDLLVTISEPITNPNEPEGVQAFQRIVSTLTVRDWGLFG
jgi:hypothetical protein